MAIRGPGGPKPDVVQQQAQVGAKPLREQPASPLQRLIDFGAARTPQEALKVLRELLATLRAAGFPVPATGNAERQLGEGLRLFQESRGLPPHGRLDDKTRDALVDAGLLPRGDAGASQDAAAAKGRDVQRDPQVDLRPRADVKLGVGELALRAPTGNEARPEGAHSSQTVELSQLSERAARDKPPEVDLKGFLSSLRAAGFAGAGKGSEQLKDALKRLQKAEGLPTTGQLDARTGEALVRRGIVDERVLPLTMASAQDAPRAGDDAQGARGRDEPAGGMGDAKDAAASSRADGGQGAEGARGGGDIEDPWREGRAGNAPAGDEDLDDARRGHANVHDEDADVAAGHWQVPALSVQIEAGLGAIARDDDGTGAATYAWDFTLFRPGVYGKKQPAEKLFHLVVTRASPFDPLWEQARSALNEKLAALEPEARRLTSDDVTRVLRVARMRGGVTGGG